MADNTVLDQEVVVSHTFDAPLNKVWDTWTNADKIKQWWGPKQFTAPSISIDFKEGGDFLYCMRNEEGQDFWSKGTFREIAEHQHIIGTDSFSDEKGNIVPASYYGMNADWPLEMQWDVSFLEEDGKTTLTIRHATAGFSQDDLKNMKLGWQESLDKLAATIENKLPEVGETDTILNVYLFFTGNCKEAMEYYQKVFGGKLDLQTYEEIPGSDEMKTPENMDKIIHANLSGGLIDLMGSDVTSTNKLGTGKVDLALTGHDEVKLRKVFDYLAKGGKVKTKLTKEFWGDTFGTLTDRYDVDWMINISAAKE